MALPSTNSVDVPDAGPRRSPVSTPLTMPAKFAPYMPLVNVTPAYPPTLLIHGTADTDVPYNQSVLMADALEKASVPHHLHTINKGEHGLGGGDPKQIRTAYDAIVPFLHSHITN